MFRELIWNMWASTATSDSFNLERRHIMLLPWDEPEKPMRELTEEEIKEIDERFSRAAAAASASLSDRI